jgi:hypothetical protein
VFEGFFVVDVVKPTVPLLFSGSGGGYISNSTSFVSALVFNSDSLGTDTTIGVFYKFISSCSISQRIIKDTLELSNGPLYLRLCAAKCN